ncbi:MAG: signal peptidase II [Spirochaetes bacterium]|nr:signal peptidase II [Spirochaetota bacterium]
MTFYSVLNGDFLAHRRRRILVFFGVVAALLALDLGIKYWAERRLVERYRPETHGTGSLMLRQFPGEKTLYVDREIKVVGEYFTLTYVRNYNLGFSMLAFLERWMSPAALAILMKSLQLSATLLVAVYFFYTGLRWWVPFTLVVAGGLGNVVDRFTRGYVVDFVKWSIPGSGIPLLDPFPVWNLADACITAALVSFILLFFLEPKQKAPKPD